MADRERDEPAALLGAGTGTGASTGAANAGAGEQATAAEVKGGASRVAQGQPASTSVEELSAELARLRSDLERNRFADSTRSEVLEGLEAERRKSRRQRLLDSGAAIALVALGFSLFTYWLDDRRAGEEARQNARRELSELVSQLNDAPVDQAALLVNVGEENAAALSGTINARQQIIASQAEQLLDDHPEIARSLDYLVLGQVRARNGEFVAAIEQFSQADLLPHTLVVDVAIKYGLAGSYFGLQNFEIGRSHFERALTVGERYADATPQVREWQMVSTRGVWSGAELGAGNCAEAAEQMNLINQTAATTDSPGLYGHPIGAQFQQLVQAVAMACPGTPMQTEDLVRLATSNVIPNLADVTADG